MDESVKSLVYHIMVDAKNAPLRQKAMFYGSEHQKMTVEEFAEYQNTVILRNALPEELYELLNLVYDASHDEQYNPSLYFSPEELKQFKIKIYSSKTSSISPAIWKLPQGIFALLPWKQAVDLISKAISFDIDNPNAVRSCCFGIGHEASPAQLDYLIAQIRTGTYYCRGIQFNVDPDIFVFKEEDNEISFPIKRGSYQIVSDMLLFELIHDYLGRQFYLTRSPQSDNVVPVCFTQFKYKNLIRNVYASETQELILRNHKKICSTTNIWNNGADAKEDSHEECH